MAKILPCFCVLMAWAMANASDEHRMARPSGVVKLPSGRPVERGSHGGVKIVDAFGVIQAENYDYISGGGQIYPTEDTEGGSYDIVFITDQVTIGYYDVDFQRGANRIELRLGQLHIDNPFKGGTVNVHLGSVANDPFVSILIDYGSVYQYANISQYLDPFPVGAQDVYFSFVVDTPNYNLVNINWFRFYDAYV